jgi:hypothetical protein
LEIFLEIYATLRATLFFTNHPLFLSPRYDLITIKIDLQPIFLPKHLDKNYGNSRDSLRINVVDPPHNQHLRTKKSHSQKRETPQRCLLPCVILYHAETNSESPACLIWVFLRCATHEKDGEEEEGMYGNHFERRERKVVTRKKFGRLWKMDIEWDEEAHLGFNIACLDCRVCHLIKIDWHKLVEN